MGIFRNSKKDKSPTPKEHSKEEENSPLQEPPSPAGVPAGPLAPLPENQAAAGEQPNFLNDDGLRELTRKLKETQSSSYTESTQASSRSTDLRYAKFTISGFSGTKHAVFIPDNLKLTSSVMEQICSAIDKEVPSMLLRGTSSLCHPAKMSTPQLRKCRGFRQLMYDAKSSLGIPSSPPEDENKLCSCCGSQGDLSSTELQMSDEELTNKSLIDVSNRVLEKKVASAISSIANAAFHANVWTYTGPTISNFEVFLQQCLENGETDVFRMTAAHLQDRAYMESEASRILLKYLFENSQSMSPEAVHNAAPVHLSGDLWNPAKCTSHREFAEHGFEFWSFESYDDAACKGHPITQWPWPHADLFLFFYREEQSANANGALTGAATSEADWEFSTKKHLDKESIPFTPELLAPVGHLFIGSGEAQTKKKLLQAMRMSSPVVIVDNTPNFPKQMSLFVNVVKKVWERAPLVQCGAFMADGARSQFNASPSSTDLIEAMLPSKILNYVDQEFDNSGMEEGEKLALSDVVGLMDLVKRKPQSFKETVCVVDPLHHSAEHVTSNLVSVLTSHHNSVRELQTTNIHRSLVMKAWRLHRKLAQRAEHLRSMDATLVVIAALVMVLSTTLAIWMVSIRLERAKVNDVTYNMSAPVWTEEIEISFTMNDELGFLKFCLLVLPMAAGLLTTLHSHFHLCQKWASVHMAATLTVSEIYQFLGIVGPYASHSASVNQKRLMHRLQTIVKQLSLAGVHEEDLMGGSGDNSEDFPRDWEALEQHINEYLYGIRPRSWIARKCQDCIAVMGSSAPCGWAELLLEGQEAKDFCAHVTAESYMESRVLPLRKYYSGFVQWVSFVRTALGVLLVLCLSVGAGLGASGYSLWIPVALAIATFTSSLIQWMAPSEILAAVYTAMTSLNNIDLRWQGSDIRENRSEATKANLITTTEKLCIAVTVTYAGAPLLTELDDDNFEENSGGYSTRPGEKRLGGRSAPGSAQQTPYMGRSGAVTPIR